MCKETQLFPKLNLLTNHNRLLLHMQIMLPLVDKLGTSTAKTIALRAMNPFLGQNLLLMSLSFAKVISVLTSTWVGKH